jgi:hypothetical protein
VSPPHVATPPHIAAHDSEGHAGAEAAASAAADLVSTVATMIVQAKWVDPMNEDALRKDLAARQPAIDARLATLQATVDQIRAGGSTAYANVRLQVDYQGDPQTGLTFYAGIVGDVSVDVSDHEISSIEYKKTGFWDMLGSQLVNRDKMILTVSYRL